MRCVEWPYISIAPSSVCSLVETRAFTQTARAACFLGQHSKVCCCSLLLEGAWPSLSLRMLLLCCTHKGERTELFVCVPSSSIGHRGSTRHTGLWRLGSLPGWLTSRVVYGSFLSRFSWPFFISVLARSGGGGGGSGGDF